MNKLSSYDLKRGDCVKLDSNTELESAWFQFEKMKGKDYQFFEMLYIGEPNVYSVLRPSVIVRDRLDDIKSEINRKGFSDRITTWEEVHTTKPEIKSPEIEQALKDLEALYLKGQELIKKCTELEKIILASSK